MNLTIDNALHGVSELLRDVIAPEVADPFASQMSRLACLLLTISANAVDDAAQLRVEENAAIRVLLGEVAALADDPLARRLVDAANSADPGLKITVLDDETHRLRTLLVEAHAFVESRNDESAVALNHKIWRFLEKVEQNRAPREQAQQAGQSAGQ